jgi:hypothetical protein
MDQCLSPAPAEMFVDEYLDKEKADAGFLFVQILKTTYE